MPVIFNEQNKTFKLDTPETTYALHVSEDKHVRHVYYGARIPDDDVSVLAVSAPDEYGTSGVGDFREPALQVMNVRGMSACEICYKTNKIYKGKQKLPGLPATFANSDDEVTSLDIVCEDTHSGLEITLSYGVFEKLDIVTRSVSACNKGTEPIDIRRIYSAALELFGMDYDMITLYGAWARERQVQRFPLHFGLQGVDSKRGNTSHDNNNFIALCGNNTTEESGGAYGFALVYSGSFSAVAEVSSMEQTRVLIGINPYDFSWRLEPGEVFQAPEVIMTYSARGLSGMSHNLHDIMRNNLIRGKWKDIRRPILVNNWEATYFNFNTEKLIHIAKEAADLGIEMLVMDDGWFGHRSDDTSSLGDWEVNEDKITGGLANLVREVNKLGLKFGIWFEPEMVSPDSALYKQHPDWCLHVEDRRRTLFRSQLVLDFTRKEVRDHIYEKMAKILSGANIAYVKWDMNRPMTEVGNDIYPPHRQRELWHRYILGVYELQERLITDFPDLLLENCAGGGARFDAGMLYYSPQIWTSDNTDAIERLRIQYGTSLAYPCSCVGAHVSAVPNHSVGRSTPFQTRGHVAAVGTFGYELDPTKLSDEDKQAIRVQIAEFNKYNQLVRTGDYHRLGDPFKSRRYDAWQFVSKDKNETLLQIVQILNEAMMPRLRIKLRGLIEDAYYKHEESGKVYSGALLMNAGFDMQSMWGDFQSRRDYFIKI